MISNAFWSHTRINQRVAAPALAAAALVIIVAVLLIATGHAPAQAQGQAKAVSGVTLSSPSPGELHASWTAPSQVPDDYRVIWAKSDEQFLSFREENTDEAGSAYPTGTTHTVTGLPEGEEYKVRVRARYGEDKAGPFSDLVTITISSAPDPTPAPTAAPTPDPTAESSVSEAEGDDLPMTTSTTGRLAMGGSVTGRVASRFDQDWYAVELVVGHAYVVDQRGESSGGGTMVDPFLMGLYDAQGSVISGTRSPDGGVGIDSRLYYLATRAGRHYVSAAGNGEEPTGMGTYTLSIRDLTVGDADATSSGATAWGEIVDQSSELEVSGRIGADDRADYFSFTLSAEREVQLSLRDLETDADLYLEDDDGAVLLRGRESGRSEEKLTPRLGAGTYYVRVVATAGPAGDYALAYRTLALLPPAPSAVGASATHNRVSLIWAASTDERVSGYQVLRGADAASLVEIVTTSGRDATTYADTDVAPETSYVYGVKARNRHGDSDAVPVSITTEAAPALAAAIDDASLSALSLSDVFLDFDPTIYEYNTKVFKAIAYTTVTVTSSHDDATFTIEQRDDFPHVDAYPNVEGYQFDVPYGYNWIEITVTAADGRTTQDYRVQIWNAQLRSISLSDIAVPFDSTTTDYSLATYPFHAETTVSVLKRFGDKTNVVITPADADADEDGHQVALAIGPNTITVTASEVNGEDEESETYTLVVTRPEFGSDMALLRTTMQVPGNCELADLGPLTDQEIVFEPDYAVYETLFHLKETCYVFNGHVGTKQTKFIRFFVPERAQARMTARGFGALADVHLFLYSPDGTELERDLAVNQPRRFYKPKISITLDPGAYILQVTSEDRSCYDLAPGLTRCYWVAVHFSGNVISMIGLPDQDVVNTFQLKQLTVGTTRLGTIRDSFHEVSVASTETQVTIEALPADDEDSVVITPGDADTVTTGHQVSLSSTGPDYVHVTVLGPDGLPQRTHLIKLSR